MNNDKGENKKQKKQERSDGTIRSGPTTPVKENDREQKRAKGKVNKEEEEEEEEERIPSRHVADYGILLESFKLFDHDFARYGPCAGLTRIERLNLAIKNDVELCPHALAVKDAIDNNLVDFTKPEYRDSVWRNDKETRGNFGW